MHLDLVTILNLISTLTLIGGAGVYGVAVAGIESDAAGTGGDHRHPIGAKRGVDASVGCQSEARMENRGLRIA